MSQDPASVPKLCPASSITPRFLLPISLVVTNFHLICVVIYLGSLSRHWPSLGMVKLWLYIGSIRWAVPPKSTPYLQKKWCKKGRSRWIQELQGKTWFGWQDLWGTRSPVLCLVWFLLLCWKLSGWNLSLDPQRAGVEHCLLHRSSLYHCAGLPVSPHGFQAVARAGNQPALG